MPDYGIDPEDPLPRYYQVYASLLERLRAQEFAPGEALPSERQLVQDYGVSRITISKALDLLEREEVIERQQGRGTFVREHAAPRSDDLRPRLAFCMPTYSDAYITAVLIGAACRAMRDGAQLEIIGIDTEEQEPLRIRDAVNRGVDGLLLFPRARYPDTALYQELRERRYPMVLLDRHYHEEDTDWVAFDDEGAGYAITKALIDRGHHRIAIFTAHEVRISSVRGRIQGYQRALEDAGYAFDEDLVCIDVYMELTPVMLHRLPSSYLRLFDRLREGKFTAMVAINQIVAMQMTCDLMRIRTELLQAVIEGERRSVMAQLDVAVGAICNTPSTPDQASVAAMAIQSGQVLGERAMELLLERVERGCAPPPRHITIPMELLTFD
ncbi:MAG: GntR family transcriptional regulator [Anaerolineae bacterium]|nr:GntR family transcriptional regulator [Anaerolineae bacterium]